MLDTRNNPINISMNKRCYIIYVLTFRYFQHISLRLLKRMLIILWLGVLCLVCSPFFGFGLYWDKTELQCKRYRNGKKPLDVVYAYLYFSYGKCRNFVSLNLYWVYDVWYFKQLEKNGKTPLISVIKMIKKPFRSSNCVLKTY